MFRRFSELQASQPADTTLRNLIEVLQTKFDMSARLPVLVFEAEQDGCSPCADLFRSLIRSEKQEISELLEHLRIHLDARHRELIAESPV